MTIDISAVVMLIVGASITAYISMKFKRTAKRNEETERARAEAAEQNRREVTMLRMRFEALIVALGEVVLNGQKKEFFDLLDAEYKRLMEQYAFVHDTKKLI